MTAESILFGVACVALYLTAVIKSREIRRLRALCRRVAEMLSDEYDGNYDITEHAAVVVELERAGWDEKGKER